MITRFFSKALIGLVSVTLSLFSSYKGIDVSFENFQYKIKSSQVCFMTNLTKPFTKEAEDLFKSGEKIKIFFNLTIRRGGTIIVEDEYIHSIRFDTMKQKFLFYKSEENKYFEIKNFRELVKDVSKYEYKIDLEDVKGNISFKLEAHLGKIHIAPLEREYNLMALWNWSKPYLEKNIEVEYDEI
jgi:hypothetical protein